MNWSGFFPSFFQSKQQDSQFIAGVNSCGWNVDVRHFFMFEVFSYLPRSGNQEILMHLIGCPLPASWKLLPFFSKQIVEILSVIPRSMLKPFFLLLVQPEKTSWHGRFYRLEQASSKIFWIAICSKFSNRLWKPQCGFWDGPEIRLCRDTRFLPYSERNSKILHISFFKILYV